MAYHVVILGSGRGSNARAILAAEAAGELGAAEVVGVISDHADAGILEHARAYGKPAVHLTGAPFKTKLEGEAEQAYIERIRAWSADLVVLAGFMRVIKPAFLEAFAGRMINLHPSLLPKYPGLHAIRRAWEAGDAETGCTVHRVTAEVDAGQILAQARVPIDPGMELDALEERVHAAEHELLPRVIRELSEPS